MVHHGAYLSRYHVPHARQCIAMASRRQRRVPSNRWLSLKVPDGRDRGDPSAQLKPHPKTRLLLFATVAGCVVLALRQVAASPLTLPGPGFTTAATLGAPHGHPPTDPQLQAIIWDLSEDCCLPLWPRLRCCPVKSVRLPLLFRCLSSRAVEPPQPQRRCCKRGHCSTHVLHANVSRQNSARANFCLPCGVVLAHEPGAARYRNVPRPACIDVRSTSTCTMASSNWAYFFTPSRPSSRCIKARSTGSQTHHIAA